MSYRGGNPATFTDPESSPPRPVRTFSPNAKQGGATFGNAFSDDSWYEGSGDTSPQQQQSGTFGAPAASHYSAAPSSGAFFPPFGGSAHVAAPSFGNDDSEDYGNEPPLLEELGIRFDHIYAKTQAVINLRKQISEHILDDTDLAGPVVFCLLLGACLLLTGKVHFGYIYGFSMCGCFALQGIISLMHPHGLDFWQTCSVLGYCLIPVIFLAVIGILFSVKNSFFGLLLALCSIVWSTLAATRLIDAKLQLTEQYWLVAYPVMLLYACFVLITIF